MLAKKTPTNQITLPQTVADQFPEAIYFEIQVENGRIVLRPVEDDRGAQVRDKLARLDLDENDIEAAVTWARRRAE